MTGQDWVLIFLAIIAAIAPTIAAVRAGRKTDAIALTIKTNGNTINSSTLAELSKLTIENEQWKAEIEHLRTENHRLKERIAHHEEAQERHTRER